MGLKKENVFRCDLCDKVMQGDEYAYPWRTPKNKIILVCPRCNYVILKTYKDEILINWTRLAGRQPIHVAISNDKLNEF